MNEKDDLNFTVDPWDEKYTPTKEEELSTSELDEYYEQRYYLENYET
jgi:hypothetical protein